MIAEEDLAGAALAGMEPGQRSRFIERLAATRLVSERDFQDNHIYDDYDYMSSVLEAARLCGIAELVEWEMPTRSDPNWQWKCRKLPIRCHAGFATNSVRASLATAKRPRYRCARRCNEAAPTLPPRTGSRHHR